MKTIKLITALMLASFVGKSQCDFTTNITNTSICQGQQIMIEASGAKSYTWQVNGVVFQHGDEFTANFPSEVPNVGVGVYTIKIESCSTSKTIVLNVQQCAVGLTELNGIEALPVYYDLRGNVIQPRYNEVIIKQVGNVRKKVVITDTP